VAIILSIFLINSKIELVWALLFVTMFSLMTPIGTYMAAQSEWVGHYGQYLTALAIGVFLHISTVILFESSQGHAFNLRKLLVIILGIGIAYLV
jgi:uncharacterized membrane-anchored protein